MGVASRWNYLLCTAVAACKRTTQQRLTLVSGYLEDDTLSHFVDNSPAADATKISLKALRQSPRTSLRGSPQASPSASQRGSPQQNPLMHSTPESSRVSPSKSHTFTSSWCDE